MPRLTRSAQAGLRPAPNGLAERDHPLPATHVVASGDKLLTIAWRYGLDIRDLIRWNQISNPDLIVVGQSLRLHPLQAPTSVPARAPSVGVPALASTPLAAPGSATATAVSPPRISMVPLTNPAPPASVAAVAVAPLSMTSATNNDKARASDSAVANKEGVRWMWPTQGKVAAADASSATKGIDIRGARGQAVKAAAAGAVVYSGSGLRGYGELIIIKHNDTFLSAYAHNEARLVQEGRQVAAGESIARMGNSDTTDVMLHFEIRRNGKAIDPLQYLPSR
jgi:lipoprotein NlpD